LALDIDGTLLNSAKGISPRNHAALEAARRAGVRLVLVTGRRHPAARRVAELLGDEIPLVLHNGALIVERGAVLRCLPLPREVARRAVELGRQAGVDPVLHCGQGGEGRLVVEGVAPSNTLLAYYLDKSHPDVRVVPDLMAALDDDDPVQVMFGGALGPVSAFYGPLREALLGSAQIERTFYSRQGVGMLDVLHPEVGKAEAVALLQQRWGFEAAETLAIGDNWNDEEMLRRAGLGLVMGNADPELLRLGLPVLPTNDEDGVAAALERYVLCPF
jgi:hydroxymethylpyrimidine pyrophosphatase-like HAD family hydrolase